MTAIGSTVAFDLDALADPLARAAATATTTPPPTGTVPDLDLAGAYAVQRAVVDRRIRAGHRLVGYKLGLTSAAKQKQMKVDSPLFGRLTADMLVDVGQPLRCAGYAQPRLEPEIAFVIGRDLSGPSVGAAQVLAATAFVLPAIDVLDSRFAGYSFTLPDVVADDASGAGFVLAGTGVDPAGLDLRLAGCVFEVNGRVQATAAGAAVLGHPAASVAWLVRELAGQGEGLLAGQVVLAGSLTEAFAVSPGDVVVARIDRLGCVEVGCV
jgi:2-oxo-3-hexenedioate decarboxylase